MWSLIAAILCSFLALKTYIFIYLCINCVSSCVHEYIKHASIFQCLRDSQHSSPSDAGLFFLCFLRSRFSGQCTFIIISFVFLSFFLILRLKYLKFTEPRGGKHNAGKNEICSIDFIIYHFTMPEEHCYLKAA